MTGFRAVIGSWKTIEIARPRRSRACLSEGCVTSSPANVIVPPVTAPTRGSSPTMLRSAIVLPEPDSPTIPSASPGATENDAPRTACTTPGAGLQLDLEVA